MTSQKFDSLTLSNGLTVVVQTMPGVQSAALTLMVPAGASCDRPGQSGCAAVLAEMLPRGAGPYSARDLSSAMDNLGLQRSVSCGIGYLTVTAATTADRLTDSIPLLAALLLKPHLSEEEFGPARELALQTLHSIEDEPRQRLSQQLRKCSYPSPWGNSAEGEFDGLRRLTVQDVRSHFRRHVLPGGSVLGIAGNIAVADVQRTLEESFQDWNSVSTDELVLGPPEPSPHHVEHDSAQTHIGLAWDCVPYSHPQYFEAWAAISLLSGGSSSRLFTEVREKRGLCYAVSASINTQKDRARVFGYAGTTNDRAQETLDVMVAEICRLHKNITNEELQRCKARAKSSLIMQQESTMSRSSSLARDTLFLNRVRTLQEVREAIDSLTVERVRDHIVQHAPESMVLCTIGPEPLNTDCLDRLSVHV